MFPEHEMKKNPNITTLMSMLLGKINKVGCGCKTIFTDCETSDPRLR